MMLVGALGTGFKIFFEIVQFLGLAVWSLYVLGAHWFWLQAMIHQFMYGDGHMNHQTRSFTHSLSIMSIWPISHFTFSHIACRITDCLALRNFPLVNFQLDAGFGCLGAH